MNDAEFYRLFQETRGVALAATRATLPYDLLELAGETVIDDILQETYLRAYRALGRGGLRDRAKLKSWIYTIAKREALRMKARIIRDRRLYNRLAAMPSQIAVVEDHADRLDVAGWEKRIGRALARIPARYAGVIRCYLQGLSVRETGARLNIAEGTVKSRISRGKQWIRSALQKETGYEI